MWNPGSLDRALICTSRVRGWVLVVVLLLLLLLSVVSWPVRAQSVRGPAKVSGVVLMDSLEHPIAGAEVILHRVGVTVRSDSAGAFLARQLPTGRHRLTIRAVGYQSITVELDVPSIGLDGIELLMRPTHTELEKVDVRAKAVPRHLQDFEGRRKMGLGRFVDSTVLQSTGPADWAYRLQQQIPNLRLSYAQGRQAFYNTRGGAPGCYVRIIIDGVLVYNSLAGEALFDAVSWSGPPIVAAEFYTVAQLPAEYNRLSSMACGALVLWTRR